MELMTKQMMQWMQLQFVTAAIRQCEEDESTGRLLLCSTVQDGLALLHSCRPMAHAVQVKFVELMIENQKDREAMLVIQQTQQACMMLNNFEPLAKVTIAHWQGLQHYALREQMLGKQNQTLLQEGQTHLRSWATAPWVMKCDQHGDVIIGMTPAAFNSYFFSNATMQWDRAAQTYGLHIANHTSITNADDVDGYAWHQYIEDSNTQNGIKRKRV